MSDIRSSAGKQDRLDSFAADLTFAAYRVALRHGTECSWITVELSLWRALADTVRKWSRECPSVGSHEEFSVWRRGLLVELTEDAFQVAVTHGIKGFLLEVQLDLYRALRLVVRRRFRARESELRFS